MKRLSIGTAQFGLNYGVSNVSGKVNYITAKEILRYSLKNKINTLDTAIVYGDSEAILGKFGVENFDVVTKLPLVPKNITRYSAWASNNFSLSLKRLNANKIYGLLLHSSDDLLGKYGLELYQTLLRFKEKGLVKKIGVSIYNPTELLSLENVGIEIDIVQAPFNIFDRRLESSGWLEKLNQSGVEVHSRSVFLQGLLLQDKYHRSSYFNKWNSHFKRFGEWVNDTHQTQLSAALNFSYSQKKINKVLVGVQSKFQLAEIIKSISKDYPDSIPDNLSIDDPMLINPSNWKL